LDQISGAFSSTARRGRKGLTGNIKARRGAAAGRDPSEGAARDGRAERGKGLWRAVIAAGRCSAGRPSCDHPQSPPQRGSDRNSLAQTGLPEGRGRAEQRDCKQAEPGTSMRGMTIIVR